MLSAAKSIRPPWNHPGLLTIPIVMLAPSSAGTRHTNLPACEPARRSCSLNNKQTTAQSRGVQTGTLSRGTIFTATSTEGSLHRSRVSFISLFSSNRPTTFKLSIDRIVEDLGGGLSTRSLLSRKTTVYKRYTARSIFSVVGFRVVYPGTSAPLGAPTADAISAHGGTVLINDDQPTPRTFP